MTQGENLLDNDCPNCLVRREIIAIRFSLLRSPAAVSSAHPAARLLLTTKQPRASERPFLYEMDTLVRLA
jgi:hypothetical protein